METNTIVSSMGVLDIFFISIFLVGNIVLGFISRRKCWDVKEAVFGKNSKLSDFTLVTSLSATMIPATLLISDIQQINVKGLPMLITSLVMYPAMYFIITFWLVPKIVSTKMAFSWYEYVGEIYGNIIRIIFSLCNLVLYVGSVASLFLVMNNMTQVIFNCPPSFSKVLTVFCATILILYSAFGGLRSVTITDIGQFFTFIIIVVFLGFYLWFQSSEEVHTNFFNLFNGENSKMTWKACFGSPEITIATLSFWFARLIPDFPQAIYQRCYASKSLKLAKKNMFLATIIFFIFSLIVDFIALQIMASNNRLEINEIIPYFINSFSLPGIKGLFCVAVFALAFSTADSELNACSVILANDVIAPITNCQLTTSLIRKMTFLIGFFAIMISLFATSIFDIFQTIGDWIFPLDEFSFLAVMLGIRTHKNVIFIAMFTGFFPVLFYHLLGYEGYACFLGMLGNFFGFLIAHLIWKKYFRSDDPNIYYNKKDSFKRLKDFEYDDDLMSYTEYKLKSGEWKDDLEEALRKQNEEEENTELQKRFHAIVKERMRSVVEEYDREKAEDEAYNRSLQEKKAQDYDRSIYKEKDASKDFYELKDLPETCAAYGIVKKAGHKMCRQDILNQYINESCQW